MKSAIGCDPNAQEAKEELIRFIKEKNYGEVTDLEALTLSTRIRRSRSRRQ